MRYLFIILFLGPGLRGDISPLTPERQSQQSEQYSESKSEEMTAQQEATSSDTTIKTSQQTSSSQHQQVQQIEQMTEWQKMATKEKKHVQYAQASHFGKVIVIFSI